MYFKVNCIKPQIELVYNKLYLEEYTNFSCILLLSIKMEYDPNELYIHYNIH